MLELAKLSRISISDEEAESLSHEFESILNYVSEVKEVSNSPRKDLGEFETRNVMREDNAGHESGIYTEKILNEAPARQDNFIKVKKIL